MRLAPHNEGWVLVDMNRRSRACRSPVCVFPTWPPCLPPWTPFSHSPTHKDHLHFSEVAFCFLMREQMRVLWSRIIFSSIFHRIIHPSTLNSSSISGSFLDICKTTINIQIKRKQNNDKKTGKNINQKRKLQANITNEHRCKNPQQNSSKQNPTTHWKDHIPWLSGVYPRDARILQYL